MPVIIWSFVDEFPPAPCASVACDSACYTARRCSKRVCHCRLINSAAVKSQFTWLGCCKVGPSGGFGCDGQDCRPFLSTWLRKQLCAQRRAWCRSMLLGVTKLGNAMFCSVPTLFYCDGSERKSTALAMSGGRKKQRCPCQLCGAPPPPTSCPKRVVHGLQWE